MSDADFIREVEELYLRLANADTDDLVELAKLAGLDPKTDLADSVWVPYPSFGEFRQNTLAAAVLTDYLEEHGIEVDAAAADNAQSLFGLVNIPTIEQIKNILDRIAAKPLFSPQKVPDMGVIRGKFRDFLRVSRVLGFMFKDLRHSLTSRASCKRCGFTKKPPLAGTANITATCRGVARVNP